MSKCNETALACLEHFYELFAIDGSKLYPDRKAASRLDQEVFPDRETKSVSTFSDQEVVARKRNFEKRNWCKFIASRISKMFSI